MRALTPTPPQQRSRQVSVTPVTDNGSPLSATSMDSSSSFSTMDIPLVSSNSTACPELPPSAISQDSNVTSFASQAKTEDSASEVYRLKKEMSQLKDEMKRLLDHTIESDKRLLQFTDEIFVVNTPSSNPTARVDQATRVSSSVDFGVQCELIPSVNPPRDVTETIRTRDIAVQTYPSDAPTVNKNLPGTDCSELVNSLKTTIEVLEAENNCLKLESSNCNCNELKNTQEWTEVKSKRNKSCNATLKKFDALKIKSSIPCQPQLIKTGNLNKKTHSYNSNTKKKLNTLQNQNTVSIFDSIHIQGDSHVRHIARLVGDLIGPGTSVSGVCKPGAQLLNIVSLDQPDVSISPRPGIHCEVLIAGSNDVAAGAQQNIYRHLEDVITTRSASTELVVATLPRRYDVQDPDNSIHEEIVLANAFIENLAARRNVQVLRLDGLGRKCFTRHGQHLSLRGKRLLAKMLIRSLPTVRQRQSVPRGSALKVLPTSPPGPFTLRHDSYADAVTASQPVVLSPPSSPRTHLASKPHIDCHNYNYSVTPFLGSPTLANGQH